mgnify:CR=1 FL=1
MSKQAVATHNAPDAIGPYSQAVIAGDTIYCSGQIALDPSTMQLVGSGIEEQTRQVMANLEAVLEAAGSDFSKVVKFSIFLAEMNDFPIVNEIYGAYLSGDLPARETVEVSRLPKGARIEISCIALK